MSRDTIQQCVSRGTPAEFDCRTEERRRCAHRRLRTRLNSLSTSSLALTVRAALPCCDVNVYFPCERVTVRDVLDVGAYTAPVDSGGDEASRSETPRARITHDAEVCRLVADGSTPAAVAAGVDAIGGGRLLSRDRADLHRRRDPPGCVRRRVHARRTGATCLVLLGSGWRRSSNNRRRVVVVVVMMVVVVSRSTRRGLCWVYKLELCNQWHCEFVVFTDRTSPLGLPTHEKHLPLDIFIHIR